MRMAMMENIQMIPMISIGTVQFKLQSDSEVNKH